jgi:transglutaminase-like putative cysteine protease
MRIACEHTTVYRYDAPVWPEPHTIRLRPRTDAAQRLIRHEMEIAPSPAGQSWCLDRDGNVVLETWFRDPLAELSVRSSFEVETLRENPFDFLERDCDGSASSLAAYAETPENAAVREFSESIAEAGRLPFLGALNRILFEEFEHVIREEGDAASPERTLSARRASCRDLAVLFCAVCRFRGIAARFVSGYEREASIQEQPNMHAWAEVYLPGGGWRGYDPSQGLAVSTSHIAVAAAAEPKLAAPVSGAFRGAARSTMQFQIAMQVQDHR